MGTSIHTGQLPLRSALAALAISFLLVPQRGAAQSTVVVSIDSGAERRAIQPEIYGVNFADPDRLDVVPYTVNRRGGNATTRYNWQADVHNTAADWFFMNIPDDVTNPAALPDGSGADRFVAESIAGGSRPMLTLPLIGWAPVGVREKKWGFSVGEYGDQDSTECTATGWAFWCQPDAGNGYAGGQKVTGNDPHDTSMEVGAQWVTDWLDHLDGSGIDLFSLDNEPMLWSETHFDLHPDPVTYDELWLQTVEIAGAVKQSAPLAEVSGPAVWGWCAYFHSAADGCYPGADQAAHGGKPFLEWYLDQVCAYESSNGVRLVDYLDVHYYPQGGQALSGEGNASLQALRLRSVKDLYDPSYAAESWIPEPVRLIPRLRALIDQHCPGTKLAITEYNWGDGCGTCALVQAEVLAIFGREGVDLATRWVAPEGNTLDEDAFRLFLNYDGAGSRVTGESLRTMSSDVDAVGAYGVDSGDGRLLLLLFNKATTGRTVQVSSSGPLVGPAQLYRFTTSSRLASLGPVAVVEPWTLALPPRSASLVVLPVGEVIFTDGFESGGTSAWSSST